MKRTLSDDERKLLHSIIHGRDADWWKVVPDVLKRNAALRALEEMRLIEITPNAMRATGRGRISNQKAVRNRLVGGRR